MWEKGDFLGFENISGKILKKEECEKKLYWVCIFIGLEISCIFRFEWEKCEKDFLGFAIKWAYILFLFIIKKPQLLCEDHIHIGKQLIK